LLCSCAANFTKQRYTNFGHHKRDNLQSSENISPVFLSGRRQEISNGEINNNELAEAKAEQATPSENLRFSAQRQPGRKPAANPQHVKLNLSPRHLQKAGTGKNTRETIGNILLGVFYFVELAGAVTFFVFLFINPIISLIILAGCWLLVGLVFLGARIIQRLHDKKHQR
jgi:hypothetical protein